MKLEKQNIKREDDFMSNVQMFKSMGPDFSKWQENVNWKKVNAEPLDFIIFRSSYRKSTDPKFLDYVKQCTIPIVGVYHFIYATNENEAVSEAAVCVNAVRKAKLPKETIIFADYEYDSVNDAKKKGITITPTECRKITMAFCEEVKKLGYKTGVYMNKDYYNNWYGKSFIQENSDYSIWLADYHDANPAYPCEFHQFTSNGRIYGVNGNVDVNYRYAPFEEVMQFKSIDEIAKEVIYGKWGNGAVRRSKLTSAGYDYNKVQQRVNAYLRGQ